MSIGNQFIEANRRIQENWLSAFEALTSQVQRQLDSPTSLPFAPMDVPMGEVDGDKAIDETFDFWSKALEVQREATKKVYSANHELMEQWRNQAQQLQGVIHTQAENFGGVAREQVEALTSAAREQTKSYTDSLEGQVRTATEAAERYSNNATKDAAEADVTKDAAEADVTKDAAEETAKRNYNLMNQAQLKAELTARKLAATGTLDEMRARLRENDDA